jgi:hypothetical protein
MSALSNVFQSITIVDKENTHIEIRGNGAICIENYDTGHEIYIDINPVQMKAIASFLHKAASGAFDGIGIMEGGLS